MSTKSVQKVLYKSDKYKDSDFVSLMNNVNIIWKKILRWGEGAKRYLAPIVSDIAGVGGGSASVTVHRGLRRWDFPRL